MSEKINKSLGDCWTRARWQFADLSGETTITLQHTASPEGPRGWGVDCPEAYNFLLVHMQVAKSNIYMQHYHREAGVLH